MHGNAKSTWGPVIYLIHFWDPDRTVRICGSRGGRETWNSFNLFREYVIYFRAPAAEMSQNARNLFNLFLESVCHLRTTISAWIP